MPGRKSAAPDEFMGLVKLSKFAKDNGLSASFMKQLLGSGVPLVRNQGNRYINPVAAQRWVDTMSGGSALPKESA